jgi:hypothetical protein
MAVRDVVMAEFLAISARLSWQLSGAGARYIQDLGSWIRGQLAWGLSSARFTQEGASLPQDRAAAPHPADQIARGRAARLLAGAGL